MKGISHVKSHQTWSSQSRRPGDQSAEAFGERKSEPQRKWTGVWKPRNEKRWKWPRFSREKKPATVRREDDWNPSRDFPG